MANVKHAQRDGDEGRVVASSGGVQVRKWVASDAAAVPVVRFEMASARNEPVQVAVTDEVPEHLDPADVWFHDDFHGDRWRRPAPREIRFETVLEPGEEVTTVYGVRQDVEDESSFRNRPEVTVSAETLGTRTPGNGTPGAGSGLVGSASDDVVDERLERALDQAAAASDDADSEAPAGTEAESTASADANGGDGETETLSLEDPTGESSTARRTETRQSMDGSSFREVVWRIFRISRSYHRANRQHDKLAFGNYH